MSNKVISTILIIFFVILVGVSFTLSMIDWAWIDVQTYEDSKPIHIAMPIPLNLVSYAMRFTPAEEIRKNIPIEILQNREYIIKALQDIQNCPDTILIKVETPKEKVIIEKLGDSIRIDVNAEDAHVKTTLPIRFFIESLNKAI